MEGRREGRKEARRKRRKEGRKEGMKEEHLGCERWGTTQYHRIIEP